MKMEIFYFWEVLTGMNHGNNLYFFADQVHETKNRHSKHRCQCHEWRLKKHLRHAAGRKVSFTALQQTQLQEILSLTQPKHL
jgi:hypothetical protein